MIDLSKLPDNCDNCGKKTNLKDRVLIPRETEPQDEYYCKECAKEEGYDV